MLNQTQHSWEIYNSIIIVLIMNTYEIFWNNFILQILKSRNIKKNLSYLDLFQITIQVKKTRYRMG